MSGRAHPRSRGENSISGLIVDRATGSSPLTRGKRVLPGRGSGVPGLIPAHAGKTEELTCGCVVAWAHPRSRGENERNRGRKYGGLGSSPLTRGKPHACHAVFVPSGLIPAHAGKTSAGICLWRRAKAHPRSRGENNAGDQDDSGSWGSSPLTRGKRTTLNADRPHVGLIPAHAGKTVECMGGHQVLEAHPRSRGENRLATRPRRRRTRLIPAHAGKTRRAGQ